MDSNISSTSTGLSAKDLNMWLIDWTEGMAESARVPLKRTIFDILAAAHKVLSFSLLPYSGRPLGKDARDLRSNIYQTSTFLVCQHHYLPPCLQFDI